MDGVYLTASAMPNLLKKLLTSSIFFHLNLNAEFFVSAKNENNDDYLFYNYIFLRNR